MAFSPRHPASVTPSPAPARALLLALAATCVVYLAAGVWWTTSESGFPYAPRHDPDVDADRAGLEHSAVAPWVISAAVVGLVTIRALGRVVPGSAPRQVAVASAAAMGVGCLVAVPDGRGLVAAAHVPVLLVGKPFGWPPGVTISSQLPWAVVHQLLLMVVGAGWLTAAVVARRAGRGACTRCGRGLRRVDGLSPPAAERWGRRAVVVAVVGPAAYASSRIAWALDLPFGVTREWMNQMRADEPTIFVAGAAMGTLGLAGALLTVGLVAGWGEVWPRWIPHFRGRPVRPMTAVVPASVVAVLLVSAGKGWHVAAARGELPEAVLGPNWATVIFGVTLVPWGVALAVAAYCYWLRRRGECPRCRRGGAAGHEPLVSAGRQMSAQQSCEHPGTRRERC